MKGNRVIDFGAYPSGLQMRAQPIAFSHADHELIVNVRAVRRPRRERHRALEARVLEQRFVPLGISTPRRRPASQMWKLDAQNRRLKGIDPEVCSDDLVMIFDLASVLPNRAQLPGKGSI